MEMTAATSPITGWLDRPRADRGMRFATDDGGWIYVPYDELAVQARRASARLRAGGLDAGDRVLLLLPSEPAFVAWLFGAFASELTVTPVAPLGYFQDLDAHVEHVRRVIEQTGPRAVVTRADLRDFALRAVEGLSAPPLLLDADDLGPDEARPAAPAPIPLLQLTSGSSGAPRGVLISADALAAQIDQIELHTAYRDGDMAATWLPLHHDMGLVGCVISTVMRGVDVSVMQPHQFIRDPARWVACFDAGGATLTACPTFGWGYAAKHMRPEQLAGLDLSHWRVAIVGAERVGPAALAAFADATQSCGFSPTTFMPGYGLAEATLAVTLTDVREEPVAARIDWNELRVGEHVSVHERRGLLDASRASDPSEWLIGCGTAVEGAAVRIVDERGEPLPPGHLGEIAVRGINLAAGYAPSGAETESCFGADGELRTGDAGFVLDGSLYVVGRTGDSLSVRGRNVYMEDLETRLAELPAVPRGRCATFAGASGVVALVELPPGPWIEETSALLRRSLGHTATVTVLAAQPGTIMRTSSGKPRRRAMWRTFVEGRLSGVLQVHGDAGSGPEPVLPGTSAGAT
jgi:fatty-acyl-CoA synthase